MGDARRTRSVGTKLSEEEYVKVEALAAQRGVRISPAPASLAFTGSSPTARLNLKRF